MLVPRPLIVPFTKMSGAGNDFIVLDNRFLAFSLDELSTLARRFCPRRVGIGADGLLALDEPRAAAEEGVHFRMRYYNADGSLGTMCGNGARCLARFAARAGLGDPRPSGAAGLVFDTDGGRYRAEVPEALTGDVVLDVPPSRGFSSDPEAIHTPSTGVHEVFRIWTGTEHAVMFVDDVAAADVSGIGAEIRRAAAFQPEGTNVNFVQVAEQGGEESPARVVVRTFEKGVEAETLACGTGAVASAVASRLTGRVDASEVAVQMPGGTLRVGFTLLDGEPSDLTLSGPAVAVYEGTLEWTG